MKNSDAYGNGYDRGFAAGTMNSPNSKYPEGSVEYKNYMLGYKKGVSAYNVMVKRYKGNN